MMSPAAGGRLSPISVPGPQVVCNDLTLGYGSGRPAVEGVSLTLASGSLTAIAGPNGAGKSTLLKALTGQLTPEAGRIDLGGLDRRALGYLPQQTEIDRSFPICVAEMAAMGLWQRLGPFRAIGRRQGAAVLQALATVGIADLADRPIAALSGGQMQRLLFARLLLQDARLILLDEPFAAIDEATAAELIVVIRGWHEEGRTVLAVLHDLDAIRAHFPDCLLIAGRMIAAGPTHRVLTAEALGRARLAQARHS
jgi:zinc/manganese transport system ATP-binding protein